MGAPIAIELDGQYRTMREGIGLLDRSDRGKLLVEGPEAAEYLQGQLTNDVEALEPGEGCYAALLDRKGKMQADLRTLRLADDRIWLDCEPEARETLLAHLDLYRVGREVSVADVSGGWAILSLLGPAASTILSSPPKGTEHRHSELELGGAVVRAVITDRGYDLIVEVDREATIRDEVLTSGADPVSPEAAEIVRVEAGRPRFGAEMTTATIPEEAGINDRAVSLTKGCYIGQETVARLHYKGKPNRHLRGLRLDGDAAAGDQIRLGDRVLGELGTAVLSPALGRIGLAILRREAEPGDVVVVGSETTAEVVELPFVDGD